MPRKRKLKSTEVVTESITAIDEELVHKSRKMSEDTVTPPTVLLKIEHCRNAQTVIDALRSVHSNLDVRVNEKKPRSKTFEISVTEGDKETLIWSGVKKGPPRKLKFPSPEEIKDKFKKVIS